MFKSRKIAKETVPELDLLDLKIIEMFLDDRREYLAKKIFESDGFPLAEIRSLGYINTTASKIEKLIQIKEA